MINERNIALQGVHNIRDLGGIKVEGGVVRPGKLIRSSSLAAASASDIRTLTDVCHVQQVIDLRTKTEASEAPDATLPGASYTLLPLAGEDALGISHSQGQEEQLMSSLMKMDLTRMYTRLAGQPATEEWRKIFRLLLMPRDGAVLWHCSEGKDRCGMVSAMLLYALGASPEDVEADYLLTNIAALPRAEAMSKQAFARTQREDVAQAVKAVFLAKQEYLSAALNAVQDIFGGINGFLEEVCLVDEDKRRLLREMYCEIL